MSDEELRAAVQECRELLEEATAMAGEQARAELTASFLRVPEGASGLTGNLAIDMVGLALLAPRYYRASSEHIQSMTAGMALVM